MKINIITTAAALSSSLPFGVHCFPRTDQPKTETSEPVSLHCLSAFTAFPAGQSGDPVTRERMQSSLPFGVHCFPRLCCLVVAATPILIGSSLPFGVHCFPRELS